MRLEKMALCVIAAAATLASGCAHEPVITGPAAALPAGEDSAAFLDRMSSQTAVSENDAMRGILLLLEGKDDARTFQQRVELLRGKGIIDPSWDCNADKPVTKGRFAYMVYQACKFPGGVILTLTGPSERYCLRELRYREVMAEGSAFSQVTGMEFVGVLGRVDVYIRTGQLPSKSGQVEGR